MKNAAEVLGRDADSFVDVLMDTRPEWVTGSLSHFDARFIFRTAFEAATGLAVEVGTASGFSATILCYALHTASRAGMISSDFEVMSYDICPFFYADPSKKVGDAARAQLPPEMLSHVSFRNPATAADLREYHSEDEISLLFIDASHQHPWPALDLFATVDLLSPGAAVLLHDISLPIIAPDFQHWGVKHLFDGLDVEKATSTDTTGPANTGRITVPADKQQFKRQILDIIARHQWEVDVKPEYLKRIGVPARK